MFRLILKENSFQIHGTARETKMAVCFANLFMVAVETEIFNESTDQSLVWKRYINVVFCLWNINIEEINGFIEQADRHHPTIKFTTEISDQETIFLDTWIYKGNRLEIHISLTCKLTTSRQKHFSIHISLPATHQGSVKASSKAKHVGVFKLTIQKVLLKRVLKHSGHAFT